MPSTRDDFIICLPLDPHTFLAASPMVLQGNVQGAEYGRLDDALKRLCLGWFGYHPLHARRACQRRV